MKIEVTQKTQNTQSRENKDSFFFNNTQSTLAQIIFLNKVENTKTLCSGIGKCGRCKVRFLSTPPKATADEILLLTEEELKSNIRLSCKHNAKDNMQIELMEYQAKFELYTTSFEALIEKEFTLACLAIDFGSTSIEWNILHENQVIGQGKALNPMQGAGSEVMSRLAFAMIQENADLLHKKTLACLKSIVRDCQKNKVEINKIIFSANSAMTYLALGKESSKLATAPYTLQYTGGCIENFSDLPPIHIPPLLAPFVGADICTGQYFLEQNKELSYPYLFIDMGTNAEFLLALSATEQYIASVPLGPSIEGVGLTFGDIATDTSIVNFRIGVNGLEYKTLKEKTLPTSICGVGYLSLLDTLHRAGILADDGTFILNPSLPLAKKTAQFTHNKQGALLLSLPENMYLTGDDVETLLKVKAAFRSAIELLLAEKNITSEEIKNIYLSGSLGKFTDKTILASLGFIPYSLETKTQAFGNTSLAGACLLCNSIHWEKLLAKKTKYFHIELAMHKNFQNTYIKYFNIG